MQRDLKWIEVFRTLGMAGVVFFHTTELSYPPSGSEGWWTIAVSAVARFIVPAFFIISGFLLRPSHASTRVSFEAASFWKRKIPLIVVPFLFWNVIYMLMYFLLDKEKILSWNTLWLLLTGYMQLYFVFVLIQLYILYTLLQPHLTRRNLNRVLALSAVGSFLFYLSSELILRLHGADELFFEWHYGKLFIAWGLFFFWGVWLCDHFDFFERMSAKLPTLGLLTLLTFSLYFGELFREAHVYGYDSRQYFLLAGLLFQFAAANLVLVLLYRLDLRGKHGRLYAYLVKAGKDTYGIYLAHLLFISCFLALWEAVNLPQIWWLKVLVVGPATWFVSRSLVRLCRYPGLAIPNRLIFGR